jgi:dolichol-phosphate mannosyltransferase
MPQSEVLISVVSPVYRAEKIVPQLVHEICAALDPLSVSYEIILVEDGSPDQSWQSIENVCAQKPRIRGIKLSRNFGQHYAITAGLDHVRGEWIVVMDCDLQDNPAEIPRLYHQAVSQQIEIVQAQRIKRQDKWLKRLSSKIFYLFFSYLTGVKQDGSIANFGIYHRKAIHILQQMREPMRAFPAMINWVGFKRGTLEVMHQSRFEGESTYNWHRLLNLALDFTLAYSDKPLKMTVKTGFVISAGAAFYALYVIVAYSLGLVTEPGYASLIVSIWFLSGLIIFILGILGLYLGKVFESVKNRPIYIIDKILNDDVRQ